MESFSLPVAKPEPLTEDFTEDIKLEDKIVLKSTTTENTLKNATTEENMDTGPTPTINIISCSLCQVKLESIQAAKEHYEGRYHQKCFIEAIKTKHEYYTAHASGQPLSNLTKPNGGAGHGNASKIEGALSNAKEDSEKPKVEQNDGVLMYCFVCNILVNSNDQAVQHYTGKKHRYKSSLLTSLSKPAETNEPNLKRKLQVPTSPEQQKAGPPIVKKSGGPNAVSQVTQKPKPTAVTTTTASPSVFSCKLCSVNVTCESMLNAHLAGSKHRKMVEKAKVGVGLVGMSNNLTTKKQKSNGKQTIFNGMIGNTGSGQIPNATNPTNAPLPSMVFTCEACAATMNSQTQYEQHLMSQRHKFRKMRFKVQPNMGGNQQKNTIKSKKFGYKQFVKAGGGGGVPKRFVKGGGIMKNQQPAWSRTNQEIDDDPTWYNPGWSHMEMAHNATDYNQMEGYSYPHKQARQLPPQGEAYFRRPDMKLSTQNSYRQPSPYNNMAYAKDVYHNV